MGGFLGVCFECLVVCVILIMCFYWMICWLKFCLGLWLLCLLSAIVIILFR